MPAAAATPWPPPSHIAPPQTLHPTQQAIIAQLKEEDEGSQYAGLGELCELLSVSTEDSLAAFPTEQVVPLLVSSLAGQAVWLGTAAFARACMPAFSRGSCRRLRPHHRRCLQRCRQSLAARPHHTLAAFSLSLPLSSPLLSSLSPPEQVQFLGYEHNPELMLLAARGLTFLADVFPPAAAAIIRHGAVPALCLRLLNVEYIDLAEQSLQASLDCACLP